MKTQIALCAAAIALLSTSLAAALAPQTARADVTATFDVSGNAEALARGELCGDKCAFFGTLMINVTTGAATAVDIAFPGLAAFNRLDVSQKSGTDWRIAADNGDDFADLVFTTTPTPGSLVGFAGGSINFGGNVFELPSGGSVVEMQQDNDLYFVLTGTIAGPVAVAAVPEPSTWAMMALGFGLLGLVGYRKTRSDNALA
jgi:PEP-CTERM motif